MMRYTTDMARIATRVGSLFRPYRVFFTSPGVLSVALPAYLGRLSPGMISLALLLVVRRQTGSYAVAGAATAAYYLAVALTGPIAGRVMDRVGATPVLVASGAVYPAALLGIVLGPRWGLGPAGIPAVCAVAGLTVPQLPTVVQSLWAHLLPEGEARQAAYSAESIVTELVFILGPLVVSLFVLLGDPAYALVAAAGCSAVGAFGVAASPLLRRPPERSAAGGWTGPLRVPGVRVLLLTLTVIAMIYGIVPLVITAFAQERARPAMVGVLMALWSVGGIVGALWYGGRRWGVPARQQFPWALAALAASLVPLTLARGLPDMALYMLLAGLVVAPVGVLAMQLMAVVAPPETRTEAFGWQNTANYAGFALGSSLGGVAIETFGQQFAALAPSAAVLLALVVVELWRHTMAVPAESEG
jgi:MFS family permease